MTTPGGGFQTPEARRLAAQFPGAVPMGGGQSQVDTAFSGIVSPGTAGRYSERQGSRFDTRSRRPGSPRQGDRDVSALRSAVPGVRGPKGVYVTSGIGQNGAGYTDEDVESILRGMSPQQRVIFQRKLKAAGVLPENYREMGLLDAPTREAFGALLEASNQFGSTYEATLKKMTSEDAGADEVKSAVDRRLAEMKSQRTRLDTYEVTDPASIRQVAEEAFRQALGRKPKPDEMSKFTSAFLGDERAAQASVFAVQDKMDAADRAQAMQEFDLATAAASPAGPLPGGNSEAEILMNRLKKMVADAPGKITLGKTTRSYEEQVKLWNNYKAGKGPKAAKPGTSKHGDGRANDLQYSSPAVREWALKNAHKYGLSFPIYDPKLPRNRDESWHVEVAKGTLPPGHSQGDGHNHGAPAAPLSVSVDVQRPDLGARAEEFARNSNPVETAAYDIGSQFDALLARIQGGGR